MSTYQEFPDAPKTDPDPPVAEDANETGEKSKPEDGEGAEPEAK